MDEREWEAWTLEFAASFKGTFGPQTSEDANGHAQLLVYRTHFAGFEYDVMTAAVALLVQDGLVFVPAPGELMAAVRRVQSRRPAPFASVLAGVLELVRECRPVPLSYPGRAWRQDERAAAVAAAAAEAHARLVAAVAGRFGEAAARWVDVRGRDELAGEALDGVHGGAVRHRLEEEFAGFVAQVDEDAKVGLALERAGRAALGPGEGRRGLRRVTDREISR